MPNNSESETDAEQPEPISIEIDPHVLMKDEDDEALDLHTSIPLQIEVSELGHRILEVKSDRPFICDECGQGFTQRATLNRHRRRIHLPKSQECNECGRLFGCRDYLIKHLRTHTGELPYSCLKCPKKFRDKSALNQHSRSHKATSMNPTHQTF